jgi:hypothetical protein
MADTSKILVRRVEAGQATLDAWRDRPFKWGKIDCARMVASHLRRMGHSVKLPPAGSYGSALTAARRLRERGWATLSDAMDSFGFDRIPPAAALPGDVIEVPGDCDLGALTIALGNGRTLGFHPDTVGATVLQPIEYVGAWRVPAV